MENEIEKEPYYGIYLDLMKLSFYQSHRGKAINTAEALWNLDYRKVPVLTVISDEEIIKITDALCKNEGITWGDWSSMTQGGLERFIIDVYTEIAQAQRDADQKSIEEG